MRVKKNAENFAAGFGPFWGNKKLLRRLFLFAEKALDSIDSVGRILRTRLCEIAKRATRTAQLRFQHVGCDASNVRDKFRIGSGALNQKRNGRAALAAAALGAAERTYQGADAASG